MHQYQFESSTDPNISQGDGLENQLNESLISHPYESSKKPQKRVISSQPQDQKSNKSSKSLKERSKTTHRDPQSHKEEYSDFQIPAILNLAELFWKCSGVGNPAPRGNKEPPRVCPSNQKPELIPFSLFTNPLKIRGFGTSIPMFFLFIGCCLTLLIIQYLGTFYLGYLFRQMYCLYLEVVKGKVCNTFDQFTYMIMKPNLFLVKETTPFSNKIAYAVIIGLSSIFAMYFVIFLFTRAKIRIRFRQKEEAPEAVISEFTIMVENVNGNDPRGLLPVHEFIAGMMRHQGYQAPRVAREVLAKATGRGERLNNQLKDALEELVVIKQHTYLAEDVGKPGQKNKLRKKMFRQMRKSEEKKVEQITKKIKTFEREEFKLQYKDSNSIAFISYETNIERDNVIMIFDKVYGSYCSPKPLYKLSTAIQPENIRWDRIGHTRFEIIFRACISRPLLLLLVPVFMAGFVVFNFFYVFISSGIKNDKIMTLLLHVGFNLLIKVFIFLTLKTIQFLNGFELTLTKSEHLARKVFLSAVLKTFYLYLGYQFTAFSSGKIPLDFKNYVNQADIDATAKVIKYLITCSYLDSTLLVITFGFCLSHFRRYRISSTFKKKQNGEDVDSKYLHLTQGMLNKYYERPDMDLDTKYTLIYSLVFLNGYIAMDAPLLTTPLTFAVVLIASIVSLKLTYSRYKRPCHQLKNLRDHMIRRLILLPKMMTLQYIPFFSTAYVQGTPLLQLIQFAFYGGLLSLMFVNFDSFLNLYEKIVKSRCLLSPNRSIKYFSDNAERFEVDYRTEYLGLNPSKVHEERKKADGSVHVKSST